MALLILFIAVMSFTITCASENGFSNFVKVRVYEEGTFEDVEAGAWYEDDVMSVYELGLMNGTSANIFNPKGDISVAEVVTLAARLHSIYNGDGEEFLPSSPWYQTYIDYAEKTV